MRHLESVPTHIRVYRGIIESLGTYERLESTTRRALELFDLSHDAYFPNYIGASLLRRREFTELQRHSLDLRRQTPDQVVEEIETVLPRTQYQTLDVTLDNVYLEGNVTHGYRLNLSFEDPLFIIERQSVFRALGNLAGKTFIAPGDMSISLCMVRLPVPSKAIEALQEQLPQKIYLERPVVSVFAGQQMLSYGS